MMLSWIFSSSRHCVPVWDEQVSAAVAATLVNPALLEDLPFSLRQHPLVQGAAIARRSLGQLSSAQRHDAIHWFSGNGSALRMLLRADFFSRSPSMSLAPGSDALALVTRKLAQEVPQLKLNADFAICACLADPFALFNYPTDIQSEEGVLVRVLEAAAFTAPGEWPDLAQMGAWQLWERLSPEVKRQSSARKALVFHLQKERALSASYESFPAELTQMAQECPILREWIGAQAAVHE